MRAISVSIARKIIYNKLDLGLAGWLALNDGLKENIDHYTGMLLTKAGHTIVHIKVKYDKLSHEVNHKVKVQRKLYVNLKHASNNPKG